MEKVSIIILQFNRSDRTLACLESVSKLTYKYFDVIIVDNASDVEHLKNVEYWVDSRKKENNSKYILKVNQENMGYSGGNNVGISCAIENGADKILILNNDVILSPNFLEELQKTQGDVVGVEEGKDILGLKYLVGHVLLINKEVFEKIGLLDERYFLYYDDVEFCLRAYRAKLKLAMSPIKVVHAISSSTSLLGPATLLYYHTRNIFLLYSTYAPRHIRIVLPLWKSWIRLKQNIKIAFGANREISRAILQALNDYDNNRFGMRIK